MKRIRLSEWWVRGVIGGLRSFISDGWGAMEESEQIALHTVTDSRCTGS